MRHWLVKSEPSVYAWSDFVAEGTARWDGIRNYQARNNLLAMKRGDAVLFYHSGDLKSVAGVARVVREAYGDPSGQDEGWMCVDLKAIKQLQTPVRLEAIRGHPRLAGIALLKQSRLSVVPLTAVEFDTIVRMGTRA
jgi:predicted RNA-binding protein with PUA-like domain